MCRNRYIGQCTIERTQLWNMPTVPDETRAGFFTEICTSAIPEIDSITRHHTCHISRVCAVGREVLRSRASPVALFFHDHHPICVYLPNKEALPVLNHRCIVKTWKAAAAMKRIVIKMEKRVIFECMCSPSSPCLFTLCLAACCMLLIWFKTRLRSRTWLRVPIKSSTLIDGSFSGFPSSKDFSSCRSSHFSYE